LQSRFYGGPEDPWKKQGNKREEEGKGKEKAGREEGVRKES